MKHTFRDWLRIYTRLSISISKERWQVRVVVLDVYLVNKHLNYHDTLTPTHSIANRSAGPTWWLNVLVRLRTSNQNNNWLYTNNRSWEYRCCEYETSCRWWNQLQHIYFKNGGIHRVTRLSMSGTSEFNAKLEGMLHILYFSKSPIRSKHFEAIYALWTEGSTCHGSPSHDIR